MNETSAMFEIIQATLSRESSKLTVTKACELAGVFRSGYYAWVAAEPVRRQRKAQDKS